MLIISITLFSSLIFGFRQRFLASDKTTRGYFCTNTTDKGETFNYLFILVRQPSTFSKTYKPLVYMAQATPQGTSHYPYTNYHSVQDLKEIVLPYTSSSYSIDFSTRHMDSETSLKFSLSPFKLKQTNGTSVYKLFKQHAQEPKLSINGQEASNCFEMATRQEILNTIRDMARESIERGVSSILHEGDDYICEIKQKVGFLDVLKTIIRVNVAYDSFNQIKYEVIVSKHIGDKPVSNGKAKGYKEAVSTALTVDINGNSVFNGNILVTAEENRPFVMFIGINYFIEINGETTMTASVFDSRMKRAQSGRCLKNKISSD